MDIDQDKLVDKLKNMGQSQTKAEALAHGLVDIEQSISKIYGDILPSILSEKSLSEAGQKDALWNLREEIRHVEYHIHDSGILEL